MSSFFLQSGSVENEPIRIRVGGGEDSKTGDFLILFLLVLDTYALYSYRC